MVDPAVTDDLETKVMSPNVECAITRKRFTIDEKFQWTCISKLGRGYRLVPSRLTLAARMTLKRRSGSSKVPGAIIHKRFKIDENCQWTASREQGVGYDLESKVINLKKLRVHRRLYSRSVSYGSLYYLR